MSQSQENNEGIDNNSSNYVLPKNGYVLFGDHTCCVKLLNEPCKIMGDGVKLLQVSNKISLRFFYTLLQYVTKQIPQGYARHLSILRQIECKIPPNIQEQAAIAKHTENIDSQIAATQRLLDKYESIKKATVKKLMTPSEGWRKVKIVDLGKIIM